MRRLRSLPGRAMDRRAERDIAVLNTLTTPDEEPQEGGAPEAESIPDKSPRKESPAEKSPAIDCEHREFRRLFASSPRGASLARRTAVRHLESWGHPPDSDLSCTVALLVAELAANAVSHGRVPGRSFHLGLSRDESRAGVIRVEVSDASPQQPAISADSPPPDAESGRGLLLVDVLATRWGVSPRDPIGKTVWAECTPGL